jgi:two-component sensor histidine kinase
LSSLEVYSLKLCVGEAITNAVRHAYPESEPGPVDVSAREVGDDLVVTVADCGRPPSSSHRNTDDEGGFGLAFISRLTKGCTFTAARDGTRVEMLFPLPRSLRPPSSEQRRPRMRFEHRSVVGVE